MNIIHTLVTTRPSVDIPFYDPSTESKNLQAQYRRSGAIVSRHVFMSGDGLTRTVVTTFLDKVSYEKLAKEPQMMNRGFERRNYNIEHGIDEVLTIKDSNDNEYQFDDTRSIHLIA